MQYATIKQAMKHRKLTIESIKVELGRDRKGRMRRRINTMTSDRTDRIFEKKNQRSSSELSPQQLRKILNIKEASESANLYDKRWRNEQKKELQRIRSSIKLQKLATGSATISSSPTSGKYWNESHGDRPVVAIKDFSDKMRDQDKQAENIRLKLPFFKHRSLKGLKKEVQTSSKASKKVTKVMKEPFYELVKRQVSLPRCLDASLGKILKHNNNKSNLINLQKCLIMLGKKQKNPQNNFLGGTLSPWVTPGDQTREHFHPLGA